MPRKSNPWMAHVASVKRSHPGKPLSEILKLAAKTYKKK